MIDFVNKIKIARKSRSKEQKKHCPGYITDDSIAWSYINIFLVSSNQIPWLPYPAVDWLIYDYNRR